MRLKSSFGTRLSIHSQVITKLIALIMKTWKQPIDTNERDFPRKNLFALWVMIVLKACNKDSDVLFGNGKIIHLKRGQVVFGRNAWKDYFNLSPSGIEKLLKTLEKVTRKVTCERTRDCTIISIVNYDLVVGITKKSNNLVTTSKQPSNNLVTLHRVYKSEESERKEISSSQEGEGGKEKKVPEWTKKIDEKYNVGKKRALTFVEHVKKNRKKDELNIDELMREAEEANFGEEENQDVE